MQRDYILRQIEEAGSVLRTVLSRILGRTARHDETSLDLKRAAQMGGIDFDLLRVCDPATARMIAQQAAAADPSRLWLAAEMLYVEGMGERMERGEPAGEANLSKAYLLYGLVQPTIRLPGGFPEAAERMREIEELLHGDGEPPAA
jgi:hypothetical protein